MLDSKKMIIIGIGATLILGFIIGVIADRSLSFGHYGPKYWKLREKKDDKARELMQEKLMERMVRKLDLSQPQIQAIGGIMRQQTQQLNDARQYYWKKMKLVKKETIEKIRPHLLPEQQEKFDKIVQTHRKRWQKMAGKCRKKKKKGKQAKQ